MDGNGMIRYENMRYKVEKTNVVNSYARKKRPAIVIHHHHTGSIRFFHHERKIKMAATAQTVKKEAARRDF